MNPVNGLQWQIVAGVVSDGSGSRRNNTLTTTILVSSMVGLYCALRLLKWRKREDPAELTDEGKLILTTKEAFHYIRDLALERGRQLNHNSFYHHGDGSNDIGERPKSIKFQVGGRRPLARLSPTIVMKVLSLDEEFTFRELAFYEAVQFALQDNYHTVLLYRDTPKSSPQEMISSHETNATGGNKQVGWCLRFCIDYFEILPLAIVQFVSNGKFDWKQIAHARDRGWRYDEIQFLKKLSQHMVPYYGLLMSDSAADSQGLNCFLCMEDMTAEFQHPSLIDIKISTQTFEPDAPLEKQLRQRRKYPQQEDIGFRIVGMTKYDPKHPRSQTWDQPGFERYSKIYGRNLIHREQVKGAIRNFFTRYELLSASNNRDRSSSVTQVFCRHVAESLYSRLISLRNLMKENKYFGFIASSILMIFEEEVQHGKRELRTRLKIIDLAHVRRYRGGDHGYQYGLGVLISLMEEIIAYDAALQ